MGEEFEAGVCGGSWWSNSSRGGFGSSPCNSSSININDHIGSFGWAAAAAGELVDLKGGARSSEDSSDGNGGTTLSMDSTLQMMGIGLSSSSSTTDWNQSLLRGSGRAESNYNPILQEDLNYNQETAGNNFCTGGGGDDSTIRANQGFSITSSGECTATCEGLATTFPISSTSYGYPSTLLQTLFDNNSPSEQSLLDNGSMNYSSTTNSYQTSLSEFSPSLPKFSHMFKLKPQVSGQLHLSNNTPFWNASASALNDIRASFFTSSQSQFLPTTFEEKPNCINLTAKSNHDEVRNSVSVAKKGCSEPAFKRPRLETPSPLPTFKVRKEKLGDRITALQQLVSPFGKTDTASVLHEAIEYIKLLHDQVNVLSTPYMKNNGASLQCQQIPVKVKEKEGAKQDLKSRGLCLVPVSSTFPVAAETTADFWTPTFGGTFR